MTYSIAPARYAKGMLAVRCPSDTGFKTRAALLACALNGRYSNRCRAYIMSPAKVARFERLYAEGWSATVFGKLCKPE